MAILANGKVTLLDFAKSLDDSGKVADVVELLTQTNEILLDMAWIEGNTTTGHKSIVRTGLPTVTWRKLYGGVPVGKSTRATVEDAAGMLEARNEIDKDIIELNGNESSFRLSEAQAFLEAMNQAFATGLFYESQSTNPERITGLAPRYSAISGADNGVNVLSAGGSGSDNTSVWLVVWGRNTVHGFFPRGTQAGIKHEDLGLIDAFDSSNNRFRAYADRWEWKCGLTVRDWRYVVRICNIDVSDLVAVTGTQATTAATFLPRMLAKAMARIPAMGMGTAAFYANRTVREMLSIQAMEKNQNVLSMQAGLNELGTVSPGSVAQGTLRFLGAPIRCVDAILNTEATVV